MAKCKCQLFNTTEEVIFKTGMMYLDPKDNPKGYTGFSETDDEEPGGFYKTGWYLYAKGMYGTYGFDRISFCPFCGTNLIKLKEKEQKKHAV